MLNLTPLKTLTLKESSHKERHMHLSAASGLVHVGDWIYVVADDENHLAKFLVAGDEDGDLVRLFDGDLPLTYEERKAEKSDIEVLTLVPPSKRYPHGALLALGSGSKKKRKKGAVLQLTPASELEKVDIFALNDLYDFLEEKIGKLNIEGAVIVGEDIVLFQRGNKKNKINATIRMTLDDFYNGIFKETKKYKPKINVTHYDLGKIDDVPLCFTDATALPNGDIVFTAAAENTSDSYEDGKCMGSRVGVIDSKGELLFTETIDLLVKLEGVEANVVNNAVHLMLVTDADDAAVPAQLYSTVLENYSHLPS